MLGIKGTGKQNASKLVTELLQDGCKSEQDSFGCLMLPGHKSILDQLQLGHLGEGTCWKVSNFQLPQETIANVSKCITRWYMWTTNGLRV